MLSLLFNTSFWYDVILAVALVAIIWACIKFPQGRVYLCTILGVAFTAITVYCAVQLQFYYTSEGGIVGKIDSFFHNNQVQVEVENMEFSLSNIELRDNGQGKYTAQILSPDVVNLANNEKYIVLVNGEPCSMVDNDGRADYIMADYVYTFLGFDRQELCTDTLNLAFAFYNNSTYLNVSTSGGSEAAKYWNYYFNKNTFIVKIAKAEYVPGDTLSKGNGDISNFPYANYYINNQFYKAQVYHKGDQVQFPTPEGYDKTFLGWSIDGEQVTNEFTIDKNTNFYAVLSDDGNVCTVQYVFCTDFPPYTQHKLSEQIINVQRVMKGAKLKPLDAPVKPGYEFKTYTLETNEQIPADYTVENDIVVTAHYNANRNDVSFKAVYANDIDKEYPGLVCYGYKEIDGGKFVYTPDSYTESGCLINGVFTDDVFCESFQLLSADYSMQSGKPRLIIESEIMPTVTAETTITFGKYDFGLRLTISDLKAPTTIKILVEPYKFNVRFRFYWPGLDMPDVTARDVSFGDEIDVYNLYTAEQRKTITNFHPNGPAVRFQGFMNFEGRAGSVVVTSDFRPISKFTFSVSYWDKNYDRWNAYLWKFDEEKGWSTTKRILYDYDTRTFTLYGEYST